ncbi:MAG TPA: CBS domain-containing protein [Candidatus Bathyarchaeia archaeon]|nr:CBS domain-containing protein [Candidatus Bathyarchaeia archaeon]
MNERKVSEDVALVANVMSRKLIKIDANGSALQAAKKMSENKVSSVILTSNHDKIEGIITERDLVRKMCAKDALPSKTPLISLLTKLSSIITIDKNSTVEEAAYLMLKNGVRHLPVTEGNRKDIIGIITTTDFAKYLERRLESSGSQSSLLLQALCTEEEPTEERDIP